MHRDQKQEWRAFSNSRVVARCMNVMRSAAILTSQSLRAEAEKIQSETLVRQEAGEIQPVNVRPR
jgi:hypothetical protein